MRLEISLSEGAINRATACNAIDAMTA